MQTCQSRSLYHTHSMSVDEDSAQILDLALLDFLAWALSGLCPDVINLPSQELARQSVFTTFENGYKPRAR